LAIAPEPGEHLLSSEKQFGKYRIELQHFRLMQIHKATRLLPVKPSIDNFSGHKFVFDRAEGTIATIFAQEHVRGCVEFIHKSTSI
jgi:hypothetical protein